MSRLILITRPTRVKRQYCTKYLNAEKLLIVTVIRGLTLEWVVGLSEWSDSVLLTRLEAEVRLSALASHLPLTAHAIMANVCTS